MSCLAIRRAEEDDAALLATHRAAVWQGAGGWNAADLAPQIEASFIRRCVADETYVAFIAERAN